jgi:uncharacterized protein (TIGR02147 family)
MFEAPDLSEYVDYRKYLLAQFTYLQKQSAGHLRPYSYSDFSAAADIKSPNYLKLIIEGKRNLSRDMCHRFSRALKHSRAQAKEFELLVSYCQEKDPMQRNRCLKALSDFRAQRLLASGAIDTKTWEQVGDWLVWVLFAMIDQKDVCFKPSSLVKLLGGQANESQVEKALARLEASGDITLDREAGQARKTTQSSTPKDIPAELVRKIQSELIYMGLESLHRYSPQQREVSGFTMAMTEKEFEWVRFELRKLRKQLQKQIAINREECAGDKVYQVNIQLFPVTENEDGEKEPLDQAKKNPMRP